MNAERRFDRGSWAALAFAFFTLCYQLLTAALTWPVPGDGWLINTSGQDTDTPRIEFIQYLREEPTPLRVGDQLLTVEGLTVAEFRDRGYKFFQVRAPEWRDGTVLRYTVQRAGQELALDVPQRTFTPPQYLAAISRADPAGALIRYLSSFFFVAVGLLVFVRRPRNPAAHALLILGACFLFQIIPSSFWPSSLFYPFPPPSIPFDGWTNAINPSIMYMALAFPVAKLPVRRFPRLTPAVLYFSAPVVLNAAYLLNLDHPAGYFAVSSRVYIAQILLVFVLTFGSLIHTALTSHEPIARAQLKWVALGLSSFVVPGIGGWLLLYLGFSTDWIQYLSILGWFLFPICLAIAITRYRLFDIDLIVRRTLIYAVLTGALLGVYFGSVVLLQGAFRELTGTAQSELVTVISTLTIAALSIPLRLRVQRAIDRRFYRKKYDAAKTLAAFGAAARDEVDLGRLSEELVSVVRDTMQPQSVSLWLRPSDRRPQTTDRGDAAYRGRMEGTR